jgi:hypothetical protein
MYKVILNSLRTKIAPVDNNFLCHNAEKYKQRFMVNLASCLVTLLCIGIVILATLL